MQVNRKQITAELEWINRFVPGKSSVPILLNVAMVAGNNSLSLLGTDLEVGAISRFPAVNQGAWSLTVPAKQLLKYLRKLESDTFTLEPGAHSSLIIRDREDGCAIPGLDIGSFPVLSLAPVKLQLRGLDVAVPRAMFSVSEEASRFTLNGALLVVDATGGKLVTTDGHRMGIVTIGCDPSPALFRALIRSRPLSEAAKMNGGSVWFGNDKEHQMFTSGGRTIVCRGMEGSYPDYERIRRKPEDMTTVLIDAKPMAKVIDRVATFADERSHAVVIRLQGNKLTVEVENAGTGNARGSVIVGGQGTYIAGFNSVYLQDFLKHVPEKPAVEFRFSDGKESGVLATAGWEYVVMPMRI